VGDFEAAAWMGFSDDLGAQDCAGLQVGMDLSPPARGGGMNRKSATILAFPLACRRRYVRRQAEVIANLKPIAGENYLSRQLTTQWDALERRGVACVQIEREIKALEQAIRAELWRAILTPGQS
jgi:hypothetical protein